MSALTSDLYIARTRGQIVAPTLCVRGPAASGRGRITEIPLTVRHPRYHLHFTPTSASWLNQGLWQAIEQYLAHHNEHCKLFVWTATADAILDKVKRFCERTSETRH